MMSPFSSIRRSKRENSENKNPYSSRGLDIFSALVSELDEKRQSIYAKRVDPNGPPLVRFVFTNSGECVPVMIKTHGNNQIVQSKKKNSRNQSKKSKTEHERGKTEHERKKTEEKQSSVMKKISVSRPSHYLSLILILVLGFLVFFDRIVSIMCTCVVWYLIQMIEEQSRKRGVENETKKKKKKVKNGENRLSLKEKIDREQIASDSKTR